MATANDSGNNGDGWGSDDAKFVLMYGIGYGVVFNIAYNTIAYFTSGSASPSKENTNPPPHCKYVWRFYEDCQKSKMNNCGSYREIIKKCHEAGVSSTKPDDSSSIHSLGHLLKSYHGNQFSLGHLLKSYHGCRTKGDVYAWECNKSYTKYLNEINADLE